MKEKLTVDRNFAIDALLAAILPCAVLGYYASDLSSLVPDTIRAEFCYKQSDLDRIEGEKFGQVFWADTAQAKAEGCWRPDDDSDFKLTKSDIEVGSGFFSSYDEAVSCFSVDIDEDFVDVRPELTVGKANENRWIGNKISFFRGIIYEGDTLVATFRPKGQNNKKESQ